MLALTEWPLHQRRRIAGVLTDIDDTLTTDGRLTPEAVAALAALRSAGKPVFAITGRSVGWSEALLQGRSNQPEQVPLFDAIVAENGAVALRTGRDPSACPVHRLYLQGADERRKAAARLQQACQRVQFDIPHARLAQDSAGRETDIAFDHSEFTRLPAETIAQIVELLRAEGLTVTVSSIHINAWYGTHDKFAGASWIVRECLGRELEGELDRWVYVGDSPNDQTMFARFANSIGVANIRHCAPSLDHPPRYVTQAERGMGFAEVVRALLDTGDCPVPQGAAVDAVAAPPG